MKHIITFFLLTIGTVLTLHAADDAKAKALLDKAATAYRQAGAINIRFTEGTNTQQGTLQLKGKCFRLNYNGIQSWFDGKTQWSYAEQNQEVTISTPTVEELQSINPYMLINSYATAFHYRYAGTGNYKGKQGDKIILTPHNNSEVRQIDLLLSASGQPIHISIQLTNGGKQEFQIISYQTHCSFGTDNFRFDRRKYPDAEVIDMR